MTTRDVLTLLDGDAIADLATGIPVLADGEARLRSLALDRIWVKPGRHVHASYRVALETEGETIDTWIVAAAIRPGESARGVASRAVTMDETPPGVCSARWTVHRSTVLLDEPSALLQLFPWDYRLPTLPMALDQAYVGRELGSYGLTRADVAGYWPGVRCQIHYPSREGDDLYGKVFAEVADVEEVVTRQEAIASRNAGEQFVTPRPRAYVPALRLLVTEPVAGEPLTERLERSGADALMPRVATALATFHEVHVPEIQRRFRSTDDVEVVRGWVAFTSMLFPELARDLSATLDLLERRRPNGEDGPLTLVHRDFYDKQVLVRSDALAVLDLDTACQGQAEIDVGNFCAHLALRALQAPSHCWDPDELTAAFTDAYRARRPAAAMAWIEWYRASTLLRLASLYAVRPWWRGLVPTLIDASRRALSG